MQEERINRGAEELHDKLLQDVLDYIEGQSEYWYEENLLEDEDTITQLILKAISEVIFAKYFMKKVVLSDILSDKLQEESIFFYRDCLYYYLKDAFGLKKNELEQCEILKNQVIQKKRGKNICVMFRTRIYVI